MTATFMRLETNPAAGMEPSDYTAKEDFTTPDETENDCIYYASEDKNILSGVWECAPCKEEHEAYAVNEMMTIISGSLTLSNREGKSETFVAGDTFFIPKGTQCTWEITEKLRKFYLICA